MRQAWKKFRSCAGESIAETLISLLISSLALLMLAGAVSAADRVITASNDKMEQYYLADKSLVERKSDSDEYTITISDVDNKVTQQIPHIHRYVNDTFGSANVVAYALAAESSDS